MELLFDCFFSPFSCAAVTGAGGSLWTLCLLSLVDHYERSVCCHWCWWIIMNTLSAVTGAGGSLWTLCLLSLALVDHYECSVCCHWRWWIIMNALPAVTGAGGSLWILCLLFFLTTEETGEMSGCILVSHVLSALHWSSVASDFKIFTEAISCAIVLVCLASVWKAAAMC